MITVLGASGFIGSQLAKRLETLRAECRAIGRSDTLPEGNLGDVIYCIGLTADFRSRLFDTIEAHVCNLLEFVRNCEFDSLLYLSSTRLYAGNDSGEEETVLRIAPESADQLYNISKAMGESVVLNCGRRGRVARISNVYGPDFTSENFLASVLRDVVTSHKAVLRTAPESAKDYVNIADVVDALIQIASHGRERVYNVASGVNVSHRELTQKLHALTGCEIEFVADAETVMFPHISVARMRREFGFKPSFLLDDLAQLVCLYEANQHG
jgi:nucleoside-diphosphate-sugar epimerase